MYDLITKFPIYTAQLNTGKVLKGSDNILFIDVTVKSGDPRFSPLFAPTWEMLSEFKQNGGDWNRYYYRYSNLLLSRECRSIKKHLALIVSNMTSYEAIVFGCYCSDINKCHSSIVAKSMVQSYGVNYLGHITSSNVDPYDAVLPNRTLVYANSDVFNRIINDRDYLDSYEKRNVIIIPITAKENDDLNLTIFSTSDLDKITLNASDTREDDVCLHGAQYAIIYLIECHDYVFPADRIYDGYKGVVLNLLQRLTIYEEPAPIFSMECLNTVITNRCFIKKHRISL